MENAMPRPASRGWRRPRRWAGGILVGACLALTAGAAAAAPPFGGAMAEHFGMTACPSGTPPTLACASVTGVGEINRLGKTSETVQATINLAAFSPSTHCAPDQAAAIFTAANGDQLFMATTGMSCQTGPGIGVDAGHYVVTGGTGRFEGAGGSGSYTTRALYAANMQSGTSVTTYDGTLSLGGSRSAR